MSDERYDWEDLQDLLEELLDSTNVYYQPPESLKMSYPAIRYKKVKMDTKKADNTTYMCNNRYELIVISKSPDHPVLKKLLNLEMCIHDNHYVADNLNHDRFILYY